MNYHTNFGPRSGPLLAHSRFFAIGVLHDPGGREPIGIAVTDTPGEGGVALWRLTVWDVELPGLWIVVDRQFVPAG